MRTFPELGTSRQPSRLISVVLPEPDGPITASHSPPAISNETSSKAAVSPKRFVTCSTSINSFFLEGHARLDRHRDPERMERGQCGHHRAGKHRCPDCRQ